MVLVLLGGMTTGLRGFRTQKKMSQGDSIPVPGTETKLRLNRFEIETTADGAVKQYRSHVSLIYPDGKIEDHSITVNHPLTHRGINIFQNSYGKEPRGIESASLAIADKKSGERIGRTTAMFKKRTKVSRTNLSVLVKDFVGDFVIDVHTGRVDNRSAEHRNPAVLVELYVDEELLLSGWSFLKIPGFHSEDKPFDVLLLDYEPAHYSVLEIASSPGIGLVYTGFAGAAIGLILSLSLARSPRVNHSVEQKEESLT